MSCCRKCCAPIIPVLEYEINGNIDLPSNEELKIPIEPLTDIDLLKDKVTCEYFRILSDLEKGRRPSLEFILEEISVIEIDLELDNRECIILYYLSND